MLTALLSRADVSRHLQALHLLRELREAFARCPHVAPMPSLDFASPDARTSTTVRRATLEGIPAWSISVVTRSAAARRSVLELHDGATGQLLALMDSVHLTTLRSSLVSALAADVLAREDAKNVAVLGSGPAASSALKALRLVRSIEQVWFHEPNIADNFELAHRLQRDLSMAIRAADSVREAVAHADIVVLTSPGAIELPAVAPGTHVTVLHADQWERPPLGAALLERSTRFVDALSPVLGWNASLSTELGAVLAGEAKGRQRPDEVTVFASVGPAWLELLSAWHVYEGARHDENLTRIDLEA